MHCARIFIPAKFQIQHPRIPTTRGRKRKPAKTMKVSTHKLPVSKLVSEFRDVDRFMGLCRACPNFGKMWSCPPFESLPPILDSKTAQCRLLLYEIDIPQSKSSTAAPSQQEIKRIYDSARAEIDPKLLALGKNLPSGSLVLLGGSCANCPLPKCARLENKPCPRPESMRPSLESLGFDVVAIAKKIFGADLEWATASKTPQTLRIVCAILEP